MDNDKLNNLIQGIGIMTELWVIAYNNFRSHGMNDIDAVNHTKAFMSILVDSVLANGSTEEG